MPKGKKRREEPGFDDSSSYRKPGLESSHAHIASMFASSGQHDIAESLAWPLKPHLAKRVMGNDPRRSRW